MNDQSLIIKKNKNSIEFKNSVYLSQAYQDFNFNFKSVFKFNNLAIIAFKKKVIKSN